MRFTVGESILFLQIHHEQVGLGFTNLYRPWIDKLLKMKLHYLTCKEHHRVPCAQLTEIQNPKQVVLCDGFIFQDSEGGQWYNQYPLADFGQLNERSNWVVHYHGSDSDKALGKTECADTYLERIAGGIRDLEKSKDHSEEMLTSLQQHYAEITGLIFRQFGLRTIRQPYKIKLTNSGDELVFPEIIKVSFHKPLVR